jgi:hypothetical protein
MAKNNRHMQFDPANTIIQLCAKGMEMEGAGNAKEARSLYLQAWAESTSDFEKFTAAHYVARQQESAGEKLRWDEIALNHALQIEDGSMKANYPSLYLNIARCYEDLQDVVNAQKNYNAAFSYTNHLPDNGYGNMIRSGIRNGMERVADS